MSQVKIKNGTDTRTINSDDVKSWENAGWKLVSDKIVLKKVKEPKDTKKE
jgi:hypothetical protein